MGDQVLNRDAEGIADVSVCETPALLGLLNDPKIDDRIFMKHLRKHVMQGGLSADEHRLLLSITVDAMTEGCIRSRVRDMINGKVELPG